MAMDIESLYRTYGPMVHRRCLRMLRDPGKALDAMHDVFVEMIRHRERLHDRAPASLLLRAATNVCLNRLRYDRRHPEDPDDLLLLAIAAEPEDTLESRIGARRFLDRLFRDEPVSTRLIAVLHFVDRFTLEEVASEVGLSVSGVRKRLRGLQERLPAREKEHDHV
jgi:RNA polymerase sigma-70 factor (ECF subfamily)